MNQLRTGVLLAAIGAVAVGIGGYFFGVQGAVIGLVVAFVFQTLAFFNGAKMALKFAHAEPLRLGALPWLEEACETLSQRAGIPTPPIYISPDPQPNAFAAGRNPQNAVVCFNEGLINMMTRDEVIAVLAHELAHIRNRDTLTMTITAAMTTFISFLANIAWLIPHGDNDDRNPIADLLLMILAPITATLIQMAISRTREFAADRTAAELMGNPRPMMSALQKLENAVHAIPSRTASQNTAHMYISNPLSGGGLIKWFSTHPSTEDRVRALAAIR